MYLSVCAQSEAKDPSSGNSYFYNKVTKRTSWDPPACFEEAAEEAPAPAPAPVQAMAPPVAAVKEAPKLKAASDVSFLCLCLPLPFIEPRLC